MVGGGGGSALPQKDDGSEPIVIVHIVLMGDGGVVELELLTPSTRDRSSAANGELLIVIHI